VIVYQLRAIEKRLDSARLPNGFFNLKCQLVSANTLTFYFYKLDTQGGFVYEIY